VAACLTSPWAAACGSPDPEHVPDPVLQAELGFTTDDVVYRVTLTGGDVERVEPATTELQPGAWVEFVSADWRVHEVAFLLDSLSADARAFLERTRQTASPPLLYEDSRFVISFADAPSGRYPFRVEGNGRAEQGVVVVLGADAS
jgi:hypothetical protein